MRFDIAILASSLAASAYATCSKITVRRDWRSLTEAEQSHFIDVQQELWRKSIDPDTGRSIYDTNFTLLHRDNTKTSHLVPAFLPWHRRLLRDYEAALRTISPDISIPYWNWAAENTALNESVIWSDKAFGGDGQGDDYCVQNGRYANWTLNLGGQFEDVNVNVKHCLRRLWKYGFSSPLIAADEAVVPNVDEMMGNATTLAPDYDAFRHWLEPHHGTIHQGVGGFKGDFQGDMTAVENSPNEPVFWLHHAMVDRMWYIFQQQSEEAKKAYGGMPNELATLPKDNFLWTEGAHLTDLMPPYNDPVESAMYADADGYCYTYE
jgi:tyrosinase